VSGEEFVTTYENSVGFGLQFCNQCGSTLTGVFQGTVHGVTLGCVNEDPDIEIGMHIFVGSKAGWEILPDGIVQHDKGPPK